MIEGVPLIQSYIKNAAIWSDSWKVLVIDKWSLEAARLVLQRLDK